MLFNYITLTLRNLLKNRLFSALNIFGLALSMSVSLFVLLLFRDAHRYDQFHPQSERVYRVNTEAHRKGGDTEGYASSPYPVGEALAQGYSKVEEMTRLVRHLNGEAVSNGRALPLSGLFADPAQVETIRIPASLDRDVGMGEFVGMALASSHEKQKLVVSKFE